MWTNGWRRRKSAAAKIAAIPAEEEQVDIDEQEQSRAYLEQTSNLHSMNWDADVNPLGTDTTKTSAAAAEAGRLRRRASALQQNKVWDPGG